MLPQHSSLHPAESLLQPLRLAGVSRHARTLRWRDGVSLLGRHRARRIRSLDPNLAAEALTIVVERTQPYVSANGTVQFSHPSYQQAILTVIAQSYRDHFLELLPVFERITIPPEHTLHGLAEPYDLRVAIAVALGEVGKERLDDIIPLLEEWAAHPDARVRGAVGIALSQVVQNRMRIRPTLRLLHDWARDPFPCVSSFFPRKRLAHIR